MSLLLPIRGQIPLAHQDVETAVTRLCQGLLAHSRLAAHAVVAARFEAGPGFGDAKEVLQAARGCGWEGIPLFLAYRPSDPGVLRVEAHVRVKKRRRFRDVVVDPELSSAGTGAAGTGSAATGAPGTGAEATSATRDPNPNHRSSP